MASTDLAVVAQQLPAYLQGAATKAHDEFVGGLSASFPLPLLSFRGKEFRLRKDGQELNTRQRELSVIFIAARSFVSKRWFKDKYSSGSTSAPDCSSRDGVTPDVANPVAPSCKHCPHNQWGSRVTENGKEGKLCGDYKRLVVWIPGLMEDPVVVDVPATSLKAPKGQVHTDLMLGEYLTQLAKHGMDPTQVVTKVTFTDAEYPQMCFNFERFASEEEFKRVIGLRTNDDVQSVLFEALFEPQGEVKEAEAGKTAPGTTESAPVAQDAPAQETPPATTLKPADEATKAEDSIPAFPGKTTVMKNAEGGMVIAEDESSFALSWAKGYRPVQLQSEAQADSKPAPEVKAEPTGQEHTPEAKPEPQADTGGGGDDLLSQVAALLGGKS